MTIETEIRTRLVADGTLSALVSTRIYALALSQNPTYPAIVFTKISGPRIHNLAGASGRAIARIQFDSWSKTYIEAQAVAAAIRGSLDGFNGDLTTLKATIKIDNEFDDFEDLDQLYKVVQDYRINHTE